MTGVGPQQPAGDPGQCGLTHAAGSDDGEVVALGQVQVEVPQHGLGVWTVAECHPRRPRRVPGRSGRPGGRRGSGSPPAARIRSTVTAKRRPLPPEAVHQAAQRRLQSAQHIGQPAEDRAGAEAPGDQPWARGQQDHQRQPAAEQVARVRSAATPASRAFGPGLRLDGPATMSQRVRLGAAGGDVADAPSTEPAADRRAVRRRAM